MIPDTAPEQADWRRIGGVGDLDALIAAFAATPDLGLDTHRRVRLAVTLATLARRGQQFDPAEPARSAANLILPLIAQSREARRVGEDVVAAHWRRETPAPPVEPAAKTPPPALARIALAAGPSFWIALGAVLLLVVAGAVVLYASGSDTVALRPPERGIAPASTAEFWVWAWTFYANDLSRRLNALIVVGALYALWRRHERAERSRRLGRGHGGGVADALKIEPPRYLQSSAARQTGRAICRPLRFPGRRLDIERTVEATVEAGGWLTPKLKRESRIPDILLLIDRASRNDHLAELARTLAKRMHDGGADVFMYEFRRTPDIVEAVGRRRYGGHGVLTLAAVARRHAGARIVMAGAGSALFESLGEGRLRRDPDIYGPPFDAETSSAQASAPRLFPRFAPAPVLLTPTPADRWGPSEAALEAAGMIVTSLADAEDPHLGLLAAVEAQVDSRNAGTARNRVKLVGAAGSDPLLLLLERIELVGDVAPVDADLRLRVCAAVFEFVGARLGEPGEGPRAKSIFAPDPFALTAAAGIAALALFPRIQLELTAALWKVATGSPLSLARLARLSRLPWFRRASMPDWLRADIAAFAREEFERAGKPELWRELRLRLEEWTNTSLGGDAGERAIAIYRPDGRKSDPELRVRLARADPDARALFEERLFFHFLETGEIAEDELTIAIRRPTRATPTQRLVIAGFAVAALAAVAFGPKLAQAVTAALPLVGKENAVTVAFAALSWGLALAALGGPTIWSALGFLSRWPANGMVACATGLLTLPLGGETLAMDPITVILCAPLAPLALAAPPLARNGTAISYTLALTTFGFALGALQSTSIGPISVDQTFYWLSFLLAVEPLLILGGATGPTERTILAFLYRRAAVNLTTYYSLLMTSLFVVYAAYAEGVGTKLEGLVGANSPGPGVSSAFLLYAFVFAYALANLFNAPPGVPKRLPRAAFLGGGLLLLTSPLVQSIAAVVPQPVSAALLAIALVEWVWKRRGSGSGAAWAARESRLVAQFAEFADRLARRNAALAAVAAAPLGAAIAALTVLVFGPSAAQAGAWSYANAAAVSGLVVASAWRTLNREVEAEEKRSGAAVVLILWIVALAPSLLSWTSSRPSRLIPSETLTLVVELARSLGWVAVPLALAYATRDDRRPLWPVMLGLAPFALPPVGFASTAPSGVWSLGVVALWAYWRSSPQLRISLYPSSRPRLKLSASVAARTSLATAAALLLLAPELRIGEARLFVDPQSMRAAALFLVGAAGLPRAPVRTVLAGLLVVSFVWPKPTQLADSSLFIGLGPDPLGAAELFLAYELVPFARWTRSVGAAALALGFQFLTAPLVILASTELLDGKSPVAIALWGLSLGLLHRTVAGFLGAGARSSLGPALMWALLVAEIAAVGALSYFALQLTLDLRRTFQVAILPSDELNLLSDVRISNLMELAPVLLAFAALGYAASPALGLRRMTSASPRKPTPTAVPNVQAAA